MVKVFVNNNKKTMKSEKTFKREDGSQIKITVDLIVDMRTDPIWSVSVEGRQKGKRKWLRPYVWEEYSYRY